MAPFKAKGVGSGPANMWYAAYLGASDPRRLTRELDRLAALGITNIRILGSSELSPLKNSLTPAFRTQANTYNETLALAASR
jgi:mannan endo-1,4-beta-mannosidase